MSKKIYKELDLFLEDDKTEKELKKK